MTDVPKWMPTIPDRRECTSCKKYKDLDKDFYFRKGKPLARCRDCIKARRRKRELVKRNPIQVYDYPQAPASIPELFEKQGGRCAMCGCAEVEEEADGTIKELAYFHNDILGIYALLDRKCNLMCQAADDDPYRALQMAVFLSSGILSNLEGAHKIRAKIS